MRVYNITSRRPPETGGLVRSGPQLYVGLVCATPTVGFRSLSLPPYLPPSLHSLSLFSLSLQVYDDPGLTASVQAFLGTNYKDSTSSSTRLLFIDRELLQAQAKSTSRPRSKNRRWRVRYSRTDLLLFSEWLVRGLCS